ncbi:uncharacterized protein [Procambarus clarkii]|uniref:uncharacterized protein n=1 Tax=Procambarus clarkii TaxID=6728 RepID=UPI003742F572
MKHAGVVCMAVATLCSVTYTAASHSAPFLQDSDPSNILQKRDYKVSEDVPAAPAGEDGFYYYYYPLEEKKESIKKLGNDLDKCTGEKLLAPLIIICIFLGIIAFKDIGLVPIFQIPPITVPKLTIPDIKFPKARELSEYVPWDAVNQMTLAVTEAVESEECLPRLMCESGKYATNYTTALSLLELFIPQRLKTHMKILKDSALVKNDCTSYKCSYAEEYNET